MRDIKNHTVMQADEKVTEAQKALIAIVQQEYPVGSRWNVKAGRAVITVEVTGHNGCWWSQPGRTYGFNVVTGNRRDWMPSQVLEQVKP